jgi:hypothetical protein
MTTFVTYEQSVTLMQLAAEVGRPLELEQGPLQTLVVRSIRRSVDQERAEEFLLSYTGQVLPT